MITDKELLDLGLPSYENGYYNITDEITVDVEGTIRIHSEHTTKRIYIAQCYTIDEIIEFIKIATR